MGNKFKNYPHYGARGPATLWLVFRLLSLLALLIVLGSLAYTKIRFNLTDLQQPDLLAIGLIVAASGIVYTVVATAIWYHKIARCLWMFAVIDLALFVMFSYLAKNLSEPALHLQCSKSGVPQPEVAASSTTANALAGDLSTRAAVPQSSTALPGFVTENHVTCQSLLAAWIPCIVLAIFFFMSAILDLVLRRTCRSIQKKHVEGV